MPSSPMPAGAWPSLRPITQPKNLSFLPLSGAVVEKFHENLYRLTFNVHTDSNPLMYILTTAKLDAVSHHWVASLANYNFQLYYRVRKANTNADALFWVSWPICMPSALGIQHHAGGCPWGSCKSHWSVQLWPTCHGQWWRMICSPHLGSGDCKDTVWDFGPVPVQADQLTWAPAAPLGTQPHQTEAGGPVHGKFYQGVPRRHCSSWYCQLHTGRLPWKVAMMGSAIWALNECLN